MTLASAHLVAGGDGLFELVGEAGVWRDGGRLALVDGGGRLGERPDVVVGEAQRLDLGQLRLVGEGGQHQPQLLQRHVQHVHPSREQCGRQSTSKGNSGWTEYRAGLKSGPQVW